VSDVDVINDAIASDPVPEMAHPLDNTIELMRGIQQKLEDGTVVWHTLAEVRELTGVDEEALAKLEDKKDITYTEYMNALLARAVVRIGDLEVTKYGDSLINKLILGDRGLLFLAIVRATYGIEREVRVMCPHCSSSNDVEINLNEDFPIVTPDFDVKSPLEVKTKDGVFHLRLPNGEDTIDIAKKYKTEAEVNTAMIGRCVIWEEDEAPQDVHQWALDLSLATRRKLVDALASIQLGPNLEAGVNAQCAACDKEMPFALDWVSLLLA
jgi:hypothetical protein